MMKLQSLIILSGFVLGVNSSAFDAPPIAASAKLPQLEGVGITEHIGTQIDLNLDFRDESGQLVKLRNVIDGSKPVLLGMVYYGCPNLCNFFMNGVTDVLKDLKWTPGNEFEVLMVSIDPSEGSKLASEKKENHLKAYGRMESRNGWHFLTGSEANIKTLAAQVGFGYKWDEASKQWAHTSAAIITTPYGQVSRYLYGIMFDSQTLRLSLFEAGKNKIGGLVDQIVLFCFKFDPTRNKYSFYAMNLMRVAAAFTVLILALFLIPYWKRNRLFKQGDSTV